MLNKDEVVKLAHTILRTLPEHEFLDEVDDAVLKLNKQAILAIQLQAKIDAVCAFCSTETYVNNGYGESGMTYIQQHILALIGAKYDL